MKRFKAYIIDFDGTLIDSYEGLSTFYNHAFGAIGYHVSDEECYHFSKISLEAAYNEKVGKRELLDKFTKAAYDFVSTGVLLKYNKFFYDSENFISFIKDSNLPCALVTGNAHIHVNMVLNNLHTGDFLKAIITSEDISKQKPDPEGLLLAMNKLNYHDDLSDICYVGDSYNDYLAAKSAGITPILIDRHNEFKENSDYIRITTLDELFK